MRVDIVDPSAYTPPYDHALCHALAQAGAQVTLYTSRFAYGEAPVASDFHRRELFYRAAVGAPGSRLRAASKLAQHVPDMLRYRHAAADAQVVHFQWLPVQQLDLHLLPRGRPLVLTAHDVLPREPRPGQLTAQRRLYQRMDAVVVHSRYGRERLIGELGVDGARVHVIAHGILRPSSAAGERAGGDLRLLPPELPGGAAGPVALFFGLLRPYKGVEDLLAAWRHVAGQLPPGAELWVVGMPRMDTAPLRAAAQGLARPVRLLWRFLGDGEIAALMNRADLVVLPYREIDQSGVAFTALGAGMPLLLSDAGGFPELAETGAARTYPAGDVGALAKALSQLLGDRSALAAMATSARAAAAGPYAWEGIAEHTLALYRGLLGENSSR